MIVDEQDLRELFAQRSLGLRGDSDRVASVHRRIQRRRQRLSAAVAGAAVVVVAVVTVSLTRLMPPHTATPAAGGTSTARLAPDPLPTVPIYAGDGKLLAGAVLDGRASRTTSFTFRPTSWDLSLATQCQEPLPADVVVVTAVNGHLTGWGGCGSAFGGTAGHPQSTWSGLGVRLGEDSHVTLTLASATDCSGCTPRPLPSAEPVGTVLTGGMYQRVPFADYPLPAAPSSLEPLPSTSGARAGTSALLVGDDATVTLPAAINGDRLTVTTVSPGDVSVYLDGVLMGEFHSRGYTVQAFQLDLSAEYFDGSGLTVRPGQQVSVKVTTADFSRPGWSVVIAPVGS